MFSRWSRSQNATAFNRALTRGLLPDILAVLVWGVPLVGNISAVRIITVGHHRSIRHGVQVGAGDHAGQDAQATQPDVVLFRGEPLLLAQKADLPKIRRPPPVALRRAWLYTLPVKRVF